MTSDSKTFYRLAMAQAKAIPLCVTRAKKRELVRNMLEDHRAALKLAGWKWPIEMYL